MQEIQEVLDERQNNLDSLLAHNQVNTSLGEPFAFESEIDTNTYPVDLPPRSMDESSQPINEPDTNLSNEINCHAQTSSTWLSRKNPIKIKKELITPVKNEVSFDSIFDIFLVAKSKTSTVQW